MTVFAVSRDLLVVIFLYIRQAILNWLLFFEMGWLLWWNWAFHLEVELLGLVTSQLAAFHLNIRRWRYVLLWDSFWCTNLIRAKQCLLEIFLLTFFFKLKKIVAQLLRQRLDLGRHWLKQHRLIIYVAFIKASWLLNIEFRARQPTRS